MSASLEEAYAAIDAANSEDPQVIETPDGLFPKALHYGRRMTAWLHKLERAPSSALAIAVRAQHIRRWDIPRDSYPMDRRGYLQWRRRLYAYHAEVTAGILEDLGFEAPLIERVAFLIQKRQLGKDEETQRLEDCACLVFLELDGGAFAEKTDHGKMVSIVQKTWKKMSEKARQEALAMALPEALGRAVQGALESAGDG